MAASLSASLLILLLQLGAASAGATVTATGSAKCNGSPLRYVKIYLKDSDGVKSGFVDDKMADAVTGADGSFTVTGYGADARIPFSYSHRPDVYIQMEYLYEGAWGTLHVKKEFESVRSPDKSSSVTNAEGAVDFGVINFSSHLCELYIKFLNSIEKYENRRGAALPFDLVVLGNAYVSGGTAWANFRTIRWPESYGLTQKRADHETAHAFRHHWDGSRAHFLRDAARFEYPQNHNCGDSNKEGHAFNEGFAQYWADECTAGPYGGRATDYTIEGNVADGLRKLQAECGASWSDMQRVLEKSPGSVHSYGDFETRAKALGVCAAVAAPTPPPAPAPTSQPAPAATAPPAPGTSTPCSVSGQSGSCISTSACAAQTSISSPGFCPGSVDIQCCTTSLGGCYSTSASRPGSCVNTAACDAAGRTRQAGLCPGADNVQCCLY